MGDRPSNSWLRAIDRSLDLLVAHQNDADGRLPNYGSNDGALPSLLNTCDFGDMRPVLQAASILVRGERLYDRGPWDEEAAWFLGVHALDVPLRKPIRRSVSFGTTGFHVLRGLNGDSFGAFRCGTLHDRFSQIDMLHLDVWWRGLNVLVDSGSYQYNAAPQWHEHFMRTASHNTVMVDGRDQMLHHRQFKVLYWTKSKLHAFRDDGAWALCTGEHFGYRRHPGGCVHSRSILFLKDDLWVVADTIRGTGRRRIRMHWLGGDFPWASIEGGMALSTPEGPFSVRIFDSSGASLSTDVAAGVDQPPRGWLSRYYGDKVPVASLTAEVSAEPPVTIVSVLAGMTYEASVEGHRWCVRSASHQAAFSIGSSGIEEVSID